MNVLFTERAKKDWKSLDPKIQNQLRKKIIFFVQSGKPLHFAERLKDFSLGGYRFRIGDYRIIFDFQNDTIVVLRVGHRKEIYR